jgi:ATP-binding cassette, subfamily C, bacterial
MPIDSSAGATEPRGVAGAEVDAAAASAPRAAAPSEAAVVMARLLRSLFAQAPREAALVLVLTIALLFTSGVSLVLLVPLLGVAGLDVGGGSVGRVAELAAAALGAVGLTLNVPVVLAAYLLLVLGSAALGHLHAVRTARLDQGFAMALRLRFHEAVTSLQWAAFVQRTGSSFVHTLTHEIERVGAALSILLRLLVRGLMVAIYLGAALYVSPGTTLLVAASGGALMALLGGMTRLGRAKGEQVSAAYEGLYGEISEHLAGMRVTKSHGTEPLHRARFRARAEATARVQIEAVRNQADVAFWLELGTAAIMAAVFGTALAVLEMPLAQILLLLFLFARLVPMLTGLQRQLQSVLNLIPAVDRVEANLAWLDARAEPVGGADVPAPDLERTLRLEGVGFAYPGPEGGAVLRDGVDVRRDVVDVLRTVDLEVRAGRTTALVGPSGGGKSTVADLAVGLLAPDRGRVLVDGARLAGPLLRAWRRRIGYVNQDTFLFNDTIRANLLAVRPEASEAELLEALRAAAAGFVEALPDGLDTVVGDRGVRLSGGERQRVALARAILRRPALLVLDEATSALDPENERAIQEAIGRMAGRQTILLIAHRLATVRGADAIYVLEQGRVVEHGGWDELVARPGGRFRALCRAQGLLDDGVA